MLKQEAEDGWAVTLWNYMDIEQFDDVIVLDVAEQCHFSISCRRDTFPLRLEPFDGYQLVIFVDRTVHDAVRTLANLFRIGRWGRIRC